MSLKFCVVVVQVGRDVLDSQFASCLMVPHVQESGESPIKRAIDLERLRVGKLLRSDILSLFRRKKSLERQGLHMAELDPGSEFEGNIQVLGLIRRSLFFRSVCADVITFLLVSRAFSRRPEGKAGRSR